MAGAEEATRRSVAVCVALVLLCGLCARAAADAQAETFLRSVAEDAGKLRGVALHGMHAYATNGSVVLEYDLTTGLLARRFSGFPSGEHSFVDVAVCGGGQSLLVTDMHAHTDDAVQMYEVDLSSGKVYTVSFAMPSSAGLVGTYSVACTRRGLALVSSFYPGAQWSSMFGYDLASGHTWQVTGSGMLPRSDVLAGSADGSTIVSTTSNQIASSIYVFNETLDFVGKSSIDAFTYTQALSSNGQFLCVPTYSSIALYSLDRSSAGGVDLSLAGSVVQSAAGFTGCAFLPNDAATIATTQASAGSTAPVQVSFRDVSAFVGSGSGNGTQVRAVRNVAAAYTWQGGGAFGPGRVVFAPAGDAFAVPVLDGAAVGVRQCTYL